MKYNVRYNTGAGDELGIETLDEAKRIADEGAAYTQCDIVIEDEDGEEITRRIWYGVKPDEDEENIINFGDFGFYADWN